MLCNKAMILEGGKMVAYGDVKEVTEKYRAITEDNK